MRSNSSGILMRKTFIAQYKVIIKDIVDLMNSANYIYLYYV